MAISSSERFGFVGELRLYTYRNLFPNHVPTAVTLFKDMLQQHGAGKVFEKKAGGTSLKLADFQISNDGFAELLFKLVDPEIPDNVLSDRKSGSLRVAQRLPTEDPAVSAHFIVNLGPKHDPRRSYPTCIENIDFLPRSLMVVFLNDWMTSAFSVLRQRPGETDKKIFRPRFEFVAPASQTISDILDNGGALTGISWVEDDFTQTTFGDPAFPVERRDSVAIKIKNRPTKQVAKDILQKIFDKAAKQKKKIKVTILDENDKIKSVPIDPLKSNVLGNIFIHQDRFDGFSKPMAMCEAAVRKDLVAKMKVSAR